MNQPKLGQSKPEQEGRKIAALVWHGYITIGRGVLVLDFLQTVANNLPAEYMSFDTLLSFGYLSGFSEESILEAREMTETYNPEKGAIILLNNEKGIEIRQIEYIPSDSNLTPPEAYAALEPLVQAGKVVTYP